nr:MAG TPA: hypothetical protein [Caudoviricetes sp.]
MKYISYICNVIKRDMVRTRIPKCLIFNVFQNENKCNRRKRRTG